MNYKIILKISIFLLLFSCNININEKQKNKKINKKVYEMKKLDLQKYSKINENSIGFEIKTKDSIIVLEDIGALYREKSAKLNKNLWEVSIYDKESKVLKANFNEFSEIIFGEYKEYDSSGNLTKHINFDENYNFSIQNLISKVRNEFNIDIEVKNEKIIVKRDNYNNSYFYLIYIYNEDSTKLRYLKFDGNTGNLIDDKTKNVNIEE